MVNIPKYGEKYRKKLSKKREKSAKLLVKFIKLADLAISLGAEASVEWPRDCTGWLRDELTEFIKRHNLFVVDVDGCACRMTNSAGIPVLKKWQFVCTSPRLAASLRALRCHHHKEFEHGVIEGKETKGTERYPKSPCRAILAAQFGFYQHCPVMPMIPKPTTKGHRELEEIYPDFAVSPFMSYSDHSPTCISKVEISAYAEETAAGVCGLCLEGDSGDGIGNDGCDFCEDGCNWINGDGELLRCP